MKGNILPVLLIIIIFPAGWLLSCQNLNEDDLFGVKICDTSIVTYSGTILPILQDNCYECHTGGSIPDFDGYDQFIVYVNNGRVYGAVNHLPGYLPMPRDRPMLPACDLAQINKWIREGALNN